MAQHDLIADTHGQSAKLQAALAGLGWQRRAGAWQHPEPDRQILFLGDYIDRGRDSRGVLAIVRSLVDSGKAHAIMGNHELNALHFHTLHPEDGQPLRANSDKNIRQHRAFLDQFPPGDPQTRDALDWMRRLPLFWEGDGFRIVHACWRQDSIDRMRALTGDGVLSEDLLIRAGGRDTGDEVYRLADEITKGPEADLPEGAFFLDKDGHRREEIRVQWWKAGAQTWRELALSVPDPSVLPDAPLPEALRAAAYPAEAPPVFFGHYWLSGTPRLQAHNALCLDYSAGKEGPVVSYAVTAPAGPLSLGQLRVHASG